MSDASQISASRLRKKTFSYLRSCSDLTAITLKDVRNHLEVKLKLPDDSLVKSKDTIREIVADFHSIHTGGASANQDVEEQRPRKKAKKSSLSDELVSTTTVASRESEEQTGEVARIVSNKFKYSDEETKLVMKVTEEYMKTHNLDTKDVCVALREVDEAGYRAPMQRLSLWKELHDLMPSRSKVSLYDHVQAKLFKAATPAAAQWTDRDVAQLKQFVEQHGTRWSYIGKLMGRFPDDCKHVFERRGKQRKLSGRFTLAEDRRLFVAVQKALQLVPENFVDNGKESQKHKLRPVSEIPDDNVPWEAVAVWMDNERLGLDYLRRWPRLKHHLIFQPLASDSNPPLASAPSSSASTKSSAAGDVRLRRVRTDKESMVGDDVRMLEQLELLEPEDESDVIWSSIDRKCSFGHGKSGECISFIMGCGCYCVCLYCTVLYCTVLFAKYT